MCSKLLIIRTLLFNMYQYVYIKSDFEAFQQKTKITSLPFSRAFNHLSQAVSEILYYVLYTQYVYYRSTYSAQLTVARNQPFCSHDLHMKFHGGGGCCGGNSPL